MKTSLRVPKRWESFRDSLRFVALLFPVQKFEYSSSDLLFGVTPVPGPITHFKPQCALRQMPDGMPFLAATFKTQVAVNGTDLQAPIATAEVVAGLLYSFHGEPPVEIPAEILPSLEGQVFMNGWPFIRQAIHDLFNRAGLHGLPMLPLYPTPPSWDTVPTADSRPNDSVGRASSRPGPRAARKSK